MSDCLIDKVTLIHNQHLTHKITDLMKRGRMELQRQTIYKQKCDALEFQIQDKKDEIVGICNDFKLSDLSNIIEKKELKSQMSRCKEAMKNCILDGR